MRGSSHESEHRFCCRSWCQGQAAFVSCRSSSGLSQCPPCISSWTDKPLLCVCAELLCLHVQPAARPAKHRSALSCSAKGRLSQGLSKTFATDAASFRKNVYITAGRIQEFGGTGTHGSRFADLLPNLAKHPEPPSKFHQGCEREATHHRRSAELWDRRLLGNVPRYTGLGNTCVGSKMNVSDLWQEIISKYKLQSVEGSVRKFLLL